MGRILSVAALAAILLLQSLPAQAMTCVAYVRAVTGFDLSGNAWQWWNAAAGVYNRGHVPEPGAVMVFSRTRHMRDGHVAIVREVLGTREILIDQANWEVFHHHRGAISVAVRVIDASPNNDWTQVRVQWGDGDVFGRVNPVSGFVYPDADSHANESQVRYLQERMQNGFARSGSGLDRGNDTVVRHRRHDARAECATANHHGRRLEMSTWRVARIDGMIGDGRPR
jgi:surface antigen